MLIDRLTIWNVALTDSEIAAIADGVEPTTVRPGSIVEYREAASVGDEAYAGLIARTTTPADR